MAVADRTAIVAGGSTGIGLAAALRLLQGGAKVAICSHEEATLAPALAQLEGQGEAIAVRADVTSGADMHRLVEAAEEAFGGVDHLVFAAGIQTYGTVIDTPEEVWERTLAVNLKGAYLAAKHAVPAMIARGGGAIVLVSSVQGMACQTGVAAYAASKGGLNALTRAMALDHAGHGIRVNAVCPGDVDSPMIRYQAETFGGGDPEGYLAGLLAAYPQRPPRFIRPDEVAELIAYLTSDLAAPITGAAISIDFGLTAGY